MFCQTSKCIGKTLKTFSLFGCPGNEDLLKIVFTKDSQTEISQIRDVGDTCRELIQTLAINCPQFDLGGALPLSCKDVSIPVVLLFLQLSIFL
jgi:hypothetical protein